MDSSFVALLTKQIVTAIRDTFAERFASEIDAGHQDGKETLEIVQESLEKLLEELPKTVSVAPVTYAPPQNVVNTTPVNNIVQQTAPKTSSSRSTPSDVLKDEQGNPIKCEAVVKKTSTPCKNNAKHRIGGQCVCGLHAKSANNAQPDANKAPKGGNKAPPKGTSTFGAAVGMTSGTSNSFGSFSIDSNTEDISIGDDQEE